MNVILFLTLYSNILLLEYSLLILIYIYIFNNLI